MKKNLLFISACIGICYLISLFAQTDPDTALLKASLKGDHNAIIKLIKFTGADINTKDTQGRTPLMISALYDKIETARELLEYEPALNLQDNTGNTALMLAVTYVTGRRNRITENSYEIARTLLQHGADPTIKNKHGKTALDLVREKKLDTIGKKTIELLKRYEKDFYHI